eukprot:1160117-Pelagomonas_calceolata.AAC.5
MGMLSALLHKERADSGRGRETQLTWDLDGHAICAIAQGACRQQQGQQLRGGERLTWNFNGHAICAVAQGACGQRQGRQLGGERDPAFGGATTLLHLFGALAGARRGCTCSAGRALHTLFT